MSLASFIAALTPLLEPRSLVTDAERIAPWLTDWRGRWTGTSAVMLEPGDTAEVARIVAAAEEHGVALVPQGGNSSMVGGATPPADGSAVLLSLRRMNRLRDIAPGHAVAEAGVILHHLHEAAEGVGARFPLDLGARGSATVGGLASTNAGGVQVLRFGTMRAQVLGVEAVLSGGLVHDGLGGLKKDNRGPSIDQLLIGAEGTLGIITALRLRLVPGRVHRAVAWLGLSTPGAALDLLRRVERATDRIEAFELIPASSLAHVLRHIPGTRAPLAAAHPWNVLIEAVSPEGEQPPAALLEELLGKAGVADAVIAQSLDQNEQLWRLRHSISEAERSEGPAAQHDISLPVDRVPGFLVDDARAVEQRFPGTAASGYGHLGDGNVHFHVRAPQGAARDWADSAEGKAVSAFVHDLVTAAGGSISAEHGIGQMKRDELTRIAPPARLQALRAIKRAMDPHGIFNPGKLVD
ncbi:FAD-binding oxidoreductase [Sphingomonas astaxanthinifaciens]|uniref:Oxidoreductase n=1 Tax=Sphingomonas astaxanthinifaciens DSM 22298 TaxID=1123267 RepID=A0ABQ5Z6Y1_9SPHN|nr:FAD-binding oxidoreductase [Sphingomonas astaxanthinifaciens]GLR47775.1 oxidoreductase [Sphingomonas astaxanthinifaciens DSM 22298]